MDSVISLFSLLLTALVLENAVFTRAMDITSILLLPSGKRKIWQFGLILTGVTTLAALIAGIINPFVGKMENVQYIRPVLYIAILAVLYGIVCLILQFRKKEWLSGQLGVLTMAFFNCATYGAMALTASSSFNWLESAVCGLGVGLSFLLASYLMKQGRRCLSICNIPKAFRGLPAELVYVGLISLSLYGLLGHPLAY